MGNNIDKGKLGEEKAAKYLQKEGYYIKERNYRTKIGEIDIIAVKSNIIAFVEVKTRTNISYGFPYEAVNWKKQDKIIKSSLIYIKQKKLIDFQMRYDIIEVFLNENLRINHIEDAFCR